MPFFIITLHIIICVLLILIVLLQPGKGSDIGAAFGGGSSDSFLGSAGAGTLLTKVTTAAAIIFMITSLSLAYISGNKKTGSVIKTTSQPIPIEEPQKEQPVSK